MAEIGLGQPVFIYSACGPFVKSKKGILHGIQDTLSK